MKSFLYLSTLIIMLSFNSSYGQSFMGDLGKSISKGAASRFQRNTTRDAVGTVDEVSFRKIQARKRKRDAEKKRAQRAKLAAEKRERAALERTRSAENRKNAKYNNSRKPVSTSNPIKFSSTDLRKIDSYAKRLGVQRDVAIRLLTIDALKKH